MNVGDKIRWKRSPNGVRLNGALVITLAYLGNEWVVYTWENPTGGGNGEGTMRRSDFNRELELDIDFFEVGKRYRCSGDVFIPVRVERQTDGTLVAFGRVETPWGDTLWRLKTDDVYPIWKEVT